MELHELQGRVKNFSPFVNDDGTVEVQFTSYFTINKKQVLLRFIETFDNIGDCPHVGEYFEAEIQIFTNSAGQEITVCTLVR